MNRQILLLAITAAVISSCTTAYKTGQTPDDVYFSPARPQDEYVRVDRDDDKYRYNDDYYDDRYLRMKVHNRNQWDYFNDWYGYDRYSYRYNYYYGSYYNPYTSWNYYYNPYCRNNIIVYNVKQPTTTSYTIEKPRNFNLSSYTNTNYNNANNNLRLITIKPGTTGKPVYNNTNTNNGLSNTLKQIFSSGNSNNSDFRSSRIYNPSSSGSSNNSSNSSSRSSSSSSSSSGSSNSGGGTTRPTRGGNN